MESRSQKRFCSHQRKWAHQWNVLVMMFILKSFGEAQSIDVNCPVRSGTLFAYPDEDVLNFEYTFDPFIKTNIDLIDRFLTSDDEVICSWEVLAKESHYASITFTSFDLSQQSLTEDGDSLKIYDGKNAGGQLLTNLLGGETPSGSYTSTDRSLYLVFKQGEITGKRHFSFTYKAVPKPKYVIIRIAGIVSGSVAAVAVLFLAFKFTRCCQPCRKRCCAEETTPQRELHPLTPPLQVNPSVVNASEENQRNELHEARDGNMSSQSQSRQLQDLDDEEMADHQNRLPDELPPSYESIFGDSPVDRNKTS